MIFLNFLEVPWLLSAVVMLFRFVTSSEIQSRKDFFEPFLFGQDDMTALKVSFTFNRFYVLQHLIHPMPKSKCRASRY